MFEFVLRAINFIAGFFRLLRCLGRGDSSECSGRSSPIPFDEVVCLLQNQEGPSFLATSSMSPLFRFHDENTAFRRAVAYNPQFYDDEMYEILDTYEGFTREVEIK
ncbi:unnamed protein product [Cylicocyclus nassatus]|uniref:Uncharacterized protein n=1 Tax=Cylicocyclus nassatus TaxID=53992 RepID=A0AA36HF52_CYLNA|nr:unnamed protein product [Cylicocyclus nassatus]